MLESVLLAKVCDEKPFIGNYRIQNNNFAHFSGFVLTAAVSQN